MNFAPLLRGVAKDPALRGAPLAVFVYLLDALDTTDFRPVKVVAIACELRMAERSAGWAVHRLVETGYLEPGHATGRTRTYRLVLPQSSAPMGAAGP